MPFVPWILRVRVSSVTPNVKSHMYLITLNVKSHLAAVGRHDAHICGGEVEGAVRKNRLQNVRKCHRLNCHARTGGG
eukprot:301851-Prorocentrum_minimum.AAC.1